MKNMKLMKKLILILIMLPVYAFAQYNNQAEVLSMGGGESTAGVYTNFGVVGEGVVNESVAGGSYVSDIGFIYKAGEPVLTVSSNSLAFGNVQTATVSIPQTYTVSGTNLTADVTVTAPTGYTICTTSGGSYTTTLTLSQTAGSVATTTIYVRFSPVVVQAYNGNITNVSTGATTQNIAVTGAGITPTITVTPSTLDFGDVQTGTTSTHQTYTVSGTNLTADITITAPTGYTICTTSGGTYTTTLMLTQTAGSVASTAIYVKFSPTVVQAYNDNITNESTGATTQNIAVTGAGVCVIPSQAGIITGLTTVCQGQSGITYTVPVIANATSYIWTLPTGTTGTSTSNSIAVDYLLTAVSGNIVVRGNNSCGDGGTSTLSVTVNPQPAVANQTTSIVSGSVFTVTPTGVPSGTIYTWTTPIYTGGVTGGSTQPIGQTDISQTLTTAMATGTATYTVTPIAGACSGNPFTVVVTVTQPICTSPWIPVPNQQYNMSVIAKLYLSDTLTIRNADAIGAFVGQECRGIAHPDSLLNGIAFLTITSDVQSGETVTFKAWKSEQCEECPIAETIQFTNQSEVGTMANPFEFHCGLVELCNNFGAGYTWFSVNVNPGSMNLNSLFNSLTPCENDRIIGQQSFATYYGTQWVGSLSEIDPKAMYKMKLCSEQEWCEYGLPVDIQSVTIPSGYPWIGYLPQTDHPINTAFNNIAPTPASNDRINGQYSFAVYSGSAWVGSLTTLQRGKGYIIHLANPSVLTYPSGGSKSATIIEDAHTSEPKSNIKTNAQYNMQIIANIILPNGNTSINTGDIVYAYVGDECRGIANPVSGLDGKLFLSIGSDITSGEIVKFKVLVSGENQFYHVNDSIIFTSEMETGTMANPYLFNLSGVNGISLTEKLSDISFGDIYPNPFDKTASLEFTLNKYGKVEGKIVNAFGSVVKVVINKDLEADTYVLKINGEALASGIYTLLMTYSNSETTSVISRKMIIK